MLFSRNRSKKFLSIEEEMENVQKADQISFQDQV